MNASQGRCNAPSLPVVACRRLPGVLIAALFALLVGAAPVSAQTLTRSQLGELALEFADVQVVDSRRGQARLMQMASLPGDSLDLHLPFTPNRIERLVADGALVPEGAPMAKIYGPELEH